MTEGYSGADVSSVANIALSLVLHDYIQKHPSPEEALKHTSEALAFMRHFEDAVRIVLPFCPFSVTQLVHIKSLESDDKLEYPPFVGIEEL